MQGGVSCIKTQKLRTISAAKRKNGVYLMRFRGIYLVKMSCFLAAVLNNLVKTLKVEIRREFCK